MYSAGDILHLLNRREYEGNLNCIIEGLNLCDRKSKKHSILSYVTNERYIDCVMNNDAIKMLLVPHVSKRYTELIIERKGCVIYSEFPEKDFYNIHELLCARKDFYKQYDFKTQIGKKCVIHPSAIIENGVVIGDNVKIGALSVVRSGTIIDNGVRIGSNSVIGSEGFQVICDGESEPLHVTHVGRTHLCENVNIGDCVCIANSLFEGETYIGKGVKIDNLAYIAHNLSIGENAVITAHVSLCGSSVVEKGAWIAPNSTVLNKVTVGAHAKVGLGSVVTRDVPEGALVYGVPAKVKSSGRQDECGE